MSNFVYTNAKRAFLAGEIDLDTADVRALLVMTNTTADTEEDVATVSAFTALDEMDGAGYSRATLTGEAVAVDNANNRGEFTAADFRFLNVSAGTRNVAAVVLFLFTTNDTDAVPLAYIDTAGSLAFPLTPNGGTITIAANAEGLIQAT